MEWTTAASLAVRLGKQGFDNRHTIQKYWTHIKAYLDKGATQVVVTGHGNAGKSLLVAQMHGRARDLAYEVPPESRNVEVDAITLGDWTKLIRVLPGQTGHRTLGEIETFENNQSLEGVIHVVDFGFVQPRDPVAAKILASKDGLDTIEKLVKANRDEEVLTLAALLSDIRKSFAKNRVPRWLVIAVNKVDLFPQHRQSALEFYHPEGQGPFGRMLRDLQTQLGKNNFRVYVVETCAFETPFVWNGITVPSNLALREQVEILKEFVRTIAYISELDQ